MPSKRLIRLQKIAEELDKLAQQLRLPGIQEPQLDLPGVALDLPKKKDPNRYDLTTIDWQGVLPSLHGDVRKIVHYELKNNPTAVKEQIVDWVVGRARENIYGLLKEYIQRIPELKAKLPGSSKQMSLPGAPPEIRLFPQQEEIEEDKARIQKELEEKAVAREEAGKLYDIEKNKVIEDFKAQNNGNAPDQWTLNRLMNYKSDPRNEPYGYGNKEPKLEDIKIDTDIMTQGQYRGYIDRLRSKYNEIQSNYNTLSTLHTKLDDLTKNEAMPEPDPTQFGSYKEMVHDLRDRVIFGIQTVISDSVGYTLFGASVGKRRRWNNETSIFSTEDDQWFEDPEKMKEFLEKIPRVYDHKDNFWRSYGSSAQDIDYWFRRKYERMKEYNDALKRAKDSFGKGVRFFKTINSKLVANVDKFLDTTSFKYSEYIEATPEHRAKLNELYMEIVNRVKETSRVLSRAGSYYNTGLYESEDRWGHSRSDAYKDVDIGQMLTTKVPQYKMIESLTKLLISSIKKVAKQINDNELGPFIKQLAQDVANLYIQEKLGLKQEDLPLQKEQDAETAVAYGDPRAIKVADAWLQYASSSKLATNFQSVVKYPDFIYKGDQETSKFMVESMKERLGFLAAKIIYNKLPYVSYEQITSIVNGPTFTYRGPEDLRKVVFAQKDALFMEIQKALDSAATAGNFQLTIPEKVETTSTPARYAKLKGSLVSAIERLQEIDPQGHSSFHNQLAYKNPGRYSDKLDPGAISDKLIHEVITGNVDRGGYYAGGSYAGKNFVETFLKADAIAPLKQNIDNRGRLGDSLISMGYFIPREVREKINNFLGKGFETKESVEALKELKLQTDFSNLDLNHTIPREVKNLKSIVAPFGIESEMPDEKFRAEINNTIKKQEELNKIFNEQLEKSMAKLNYTLDITKKAQTERNVSQLFTMRLQSLGGVGPNAINGKFQDILKVEAFKHLPLQKMSEIANERTIGELKSGEYIGGDDVINLYKQFADDEKQGTNLGVALATIAKTLNLKDPQQLFRLYEKLQESFKNTNMAREDVEYIFPVLITNIDALESQLEAAKELAEFAHSDGEGLSKDIILSFARNPNFKDWIREVDAIENFFDVYIKIKRLGGPRQILAKERPVIDALVKTKAIRKGITRRLQLIVEAFENGTRINPSIEGFDTIKKLISQTNYDLNAIESYATFAEYNAKITDQKLFKDPQLAKLNWNVPDKKFRFRVLDTFDPYHFQVGVDTGCCQKLGGAGEAAAIDSYINPLAGVVLLEASIDGEYKTVAQSYFHYVPTDNGIILDNVETSDYDDNLKEITGYELDQLYAWWAAFKKEQRKYKYFLCGTSYNKLENDQYKTHTMKNDPRSFKHDRKYSDWRPSSSVNLLAPKFDLPDEAQTKKKKKQKRTEAYFDMFPLMSFYKFN